MGIVVPRPAMRKGEGRKIANQLQRHAELTATYCREGLSKEDASRKAYEEITRIGHEASR